MKTEDKKMIWQQTNKNMKKKQFTELCSAKDDGNEIDLFWQKRVFNYLELGS